jgi:hypothetical protein
MAVRDEVRARVPVGVRHRIARGRLRYRVPTGRWRRLPDALVIGAQRSGTSSLYRALGRHPGAAPSFRKEIEYFSRHHARGDAWYRAHFPLACGPGRRRVAFEATPDYLLHPLAADRAAALVPGARLVVLLRDPVARAWSHHQHMVRLGYETLDFDDALAAEDERIAPDLARLAEQPDHDPKALLRFSYAARGRYAGQVARWLAAYPPDRLLVVRSEDLFAAPAPTLARIVAHLGLAPWAPPGFANASANASAGSPGAAAMSATARARLATTFAAEPAALATLLGPDAPTW